MVQAVMKRPPLKGLIAGINAAQKNLNKKPLILKRYNSHIGVLLMI